MEITETDTMLRSVFKHLIAFVIYFFIALAPVAKAQTLLDWSLYNNNAWDSSNGFSRNYTLTGGNGNVTLAITGTTSEVQSGFPKVESLTNKGGFASPMNVGLSLRMDLTTNTGQLTTTATFTKPGGLAGLGFWITDMDASGTAWRDKLTFSATLAAGGSTTPTLTSNVPVNYTLGPGTIATKSTVGDIATTSSNGNVFVYFPNAITAFTMTYNNDSGTQSNPDSQHVTMHSFMIVPEPATFSLAFLGILFSRASIKLRLFDK